MLAKKIREREREKLSVSALEKKETEIECCVSGKIKKRCQKIFSVEKESKKKND